MQPRLTLMRIIKLGLGVVVSASTLSAVNGARAVAQDSPDVGLQQQAISLGVELDGSCNDVQASTALDAWKYLALDIRNDAGLRSNVTSCIMNAHIVEADCTTQNDRSSILSALLEAEYHWQLECTDLPSGRDVNGNPTTVFADSHVAIEGAKMRLDRSYLSSGVTKEELAGTMAHELMHNRGFTHSANPLGSRLYELTVPEQVNACIRNADSSGASNSDPDPDYWDRKLCCEGAGAHFCDSRGCYSMMGYTCGPVEDSLPNIGYNYCGVFVQQDGGAWIKPEGTMFQDAGMCGYNTTLPQGTVGGP